MKKQIYPDHDLKYILIAYKNQELTKLLDFLLCIVIVKGVWLFLKSFEGI